MAVIFFSKIANSQSTFNYHYSKRTDFFVTGYDGGYQSYLLGNNKIFSNGAVTDSASGRLLTSTCVYDTIGNLVAKKTYGYPEYDKYIIQRTVKFNNHIYGIGQAYNYNDTVNDLDLLFIKFDINGDTVFTKILHDTGSVVAADIIKTVDNKLLVLGNYAKDFTNVVYTRTCFINVDTLGNVVQKKYNDSSLYQPSILLYSNPLKEYYVLGTYPSNLTSNFVYYSYLHCFDSLLQNKFVKNQLSGANDIILAATMNSKTIYATFCIPSSNTPPNPGVGSKIMITKFRRIFNNVQTVANFVGVHDPWFMNMATGNIVINQNTVLFPVECNTGGYIYFCDTTLNLICLAKTDPGDSAYYIATSIGLLLSNKIFGTGLYSPHYIGSSMSSWNFLTNEYMEFLNNGCGFVNTKEERMSQNNFKLYPNPSAEMVFLENEDLANTELKIEFINSIGQVIKSEQTFFNYKDSFGIFDLMPGLYICKVYSKASQVATIKLIKK